MQEKLLMKYLLENYENFLNKKVSDVINNIVIQMIGESLLLE